MTLQPVVIDRFGGLNLPEDPEEIGFAQALDMRNLDVDRRGRLRTRDGYTHLTAAAAADPYLLLYRTDPSATILFGSRNTGTDAINITDGTITATDTDGYTTSIVSLGDSTYLVVAGALHKWDGAAFSTVSSAASVGARVLGVQTPDYRLVVGDGDIVSFSDPYDSGDPTAVETFGADNFASISPGDGEEITAIANWQNLLFVFKENKFAVFPGNTVTSTGAPLFNYRIVDMGVGVTDVLTAGSDIGPMPGVAVAPEGVYFLHRSGIYLTQGGQPTLVSKPIEPLFFDDPPVEYGGNSPMRPISIMYFRRRLYVSATNGVAADDNELFIYDLDESRWMRWTLGVNGMFTDGVNVFVSRTNLNHVAQLGGSTDNGSAIEWSYASGYSDLGSPEEKVIRELGVWGSGNVTVKIGVDHGNLDGGSTLTLGTAPAVTEQLQRTSRKGRFFRYGFSGTGPAAINRLVLYLRDVAGAGQRG